MKKIYNLIVIKRDFQSFEHIYNFTTMQKAKHALPIVIANYAKTLDKRHIKFTSNINDTEGDLHDPTNPKRKYITAFIIDVECDPSDDKLIY